MASEDSLTPLPQNKVNLIRIFNHNYLTRPLPYIASILLIFPYIEITLPLFLLSFIIMRDMNILKQSIIELNHWIIGSLIFTIFLIWRETEFIQTGLFILYISFILFQISFLKQNKNIKLLSSCLLMFTLIHELLFCFFTTFNINSILILIVIIALIPHFKIELDEQIVVIFLGLFLGVRAVGGTLSEGQIWLNNPDTLDPLIQNWITFLSSPLLGVLLFYLIRYLIESPILTYEERVN
tara:strand:+ start:188 stop:904 length:717 start_codon:yes stop_codon:yes gene_type:complete